MEELNEDMTPFWLQTTDNRHVHRRRRQHSSLFFNTGILIILLLVIAFAFVFIIIPSFLSFTSKIFKPNLVKKSWDSVNLVLVLFAIICGFLSKNNSNNDNDTPSTYHHVRRSNPSTPRQWDDYSSSSDRRAYNSLQRLRSSSSYPDLRQESSWMMNSDDHWRFYDDTHLYNYRSRSRREHDREQVYINSTKDIAVDSVHVSPPPPSPPPPAPSSPPAVEATASPPRPPQSLPPQLPKVVRRKPQRTYEDLKPKEKSERKEVIYSELKIKHSLPPPAARPPHSPPSLPPPPPIAGSEKRSNKSEKKRGGVTKEFLISLRRKKKKQRQRSVENLEEFFNLSTLPSYPLPSTPPPQPPPPPPPPPPLPSFYHNIFSSKKSKARKKHSVPPTPPLPPSLEARALKREPQKPPVTTQKPPLPVKISNINNMEESVESGNESPLHPIPPPPPPPPFKMPSLKFEVHGDFVRLKSINSSRSGSPDLEDPLSGEASPSDGGESTAGPLFCPSPDVNTKADNFIARFRAGLKLEKLHSVRGRSNLGPDPGPSTV